jgi:hypothetical protein
MLEPDDELVIEVTGRPASIGKRRFQLTKVNGKESAAAA